MKGVGDTSMFDEKNEAEGADIAGFFRKEGYAEGE